MKYLIVEPKLKSVAPNIALMKWARWCENKGYEYQYIRGKVIPKITPDVIFMSFIFSYYSKNYEDLIDFYLRYCPNAKIIIGGVFPTLSPEWFNKPKWMGNPFFQTENRVSLYCGMNPEIEPLAPKYNVEITDEEHLSESDRERREQSRKVIVLYSSRGCVNKCGYCAVPKLEGDMKSFKSIQYILDVAKKEVPNANNVVLYDNNFTAHEYWSDICDELIAYDLPVDIHGLHVMDFTDEMAKKFSQMKWGSQNTGSTPYLRFSFDKMGYEKYVRRAFEIYSRYDIKANFFLYMLFNYNDTPHDVWKRLVIGQELSTLHQKHIMFFPQRFEPFQALEKYKYIGKHWTPELASGMRRLSTWLHGFLTVSPNGNLFKWIGETEKDFFGHVMRFGTERGYRLVKHEKDIDLERIIRSIK